MQLFETKVIGFNQINNDVPKADYPVTNLHELQYLS